MVSISDIGKPTIFTPTDLEWRLMLSNGRVIQVGKPPAVMALDGATTNGTTTSSDVIEVNVPASKSLTNRAILLAALASPAPEGSPKTYVILRNVLFAEDTLLLLRALSQLGVEVEVLNDARKSVKIERVGKKFGNRAARSATASGASTAHPSLHLGNSGTCVRFLSGILGMLSQQDIFLNGTARMKSRPIQPLLDALKPFVPADRLDGELKTFRLAIRGSARVPNKNLTAADKTIKVDGSVSSQFLSGVLMALPLLGGGWRIEVPSGGVSETFVHMTVSVMKEFGASLNCDE